MIGLRKNCCLMLTKKRTSFCVFPKNGVLFRVYAQLCHVKCEYSEGLDKDYSTKLGYHRKPEVISKFLRRFYEEAGVCPSSVEYVEGFGSGT